MSQETNCFPFTNNPPSLRRLPKPRRRRPKGLSEEGRGGRRQFDSIYASSSSTCLSCDKGLVSCGFLLLSSDAFFTVPLFCFSATPLIFPFSSLVHPRTSCRSSSERFCSLTSFSTLTTTTTTNHPNNQPGRCSSS